MSEREKETIPASVRDAAHDWLARRQGGLDAVGERTFAAWLAADPIHRVAYARAQETWQESRLLALSALGHARRLPRAPFLMRRSTHLGAAGLAVTALVAVLTVGVVERGGLFSLVTPAEATTFQTARGEIRSFTLTDGSRVTLDTATVVRVRFSKASRQIELSRGRARFEVATADSRPFTVVAAGADVVAHSRVFDVSLAEGIPQIAVFDGSVDWHSAGVTVPKTLPAGQQAMLDGGKAHDAVPLDEQRWVSGMLALDAMPLDDAVAAINRYNAVQIRIGDPGLSALKVTGAFHVHDPDGFARAVAAMFGLSIAHDATTITLSRRTGASAPGP